MKFNKNSRFVLEKGFYVPLAGKRTLSQLEL
jgi:hypothetical protein